MSRGDVDVRLSARPRHCDAQGMLHAVRYYEYFEDAFLEWLDASGVPYGSLRNSGVDLVIVASGCEHHHPARLGDDLRIRVTAEAASSRSLQVRFEIYRDESAVAEGRITYVAVRDGHATELPSALRAAARTPSPVPTESSRRGRKAP